MRLLASIERHPWRWALAMLVPLVVFPQIDLSLSQIFFDPGRRIFLLRSHPLGDFVRKTMPIILFALAAGVAVLGLVSARLDRRLLGFDGKAAAYVILSLAVGPGLIVNALFKDYWGRPRPSTITEFFGPNHYVMALMPSDQCLDNCSFPSGHAALAFWMVSFAFLAPPLWRRKAILAALAFGVVIGLVRIAQGGHFLSDVVFSGVIVTGLCQWLYGVIIVRSNMTFQKNNRSKAAESS